LFRLQALEHLRAGRPQVALSILQSELLQQPADAQGWFLLGACHDALNDYRAAAIAFSRSLALNPANIEAQLAYMSVLRASGDLANALMASQKALAGSSDDPRLLYAAALCYDDVGRVEEALAHYEAALRRAPGMEDALHNRGLLLSRLGRLEEAESNQRRYVEAHPGAARAHAGLADMLIAQRRFAAKEIARRPSSLRRFPRPGLRPGAAPFRPADRPVRLAIRVRSCSSCFASACSSFFSAFTAALIDFCQDIQIPFE